MTVLQHRPGPADVLLSDGSMAMIRPMRPEDRAGVESLHDSASASSLRWRFFIPSRTAGRQYVEHVFSEQPPWACLVAEVGGRVVALATAEHGPGDGASAEVAFLVDDRLAGHGLGSLLLEHLAAHGWDHGIREFHAGVLMGNASMMGVFLAAGFSMTRSSEDGVTNLVMSTRASHAAVAAADGRERVSEARSLAPLAHPRCVAVVGARRSGAGVGHAVLASIRAGGFTGTLVAVHPAGGLIDGVRAYQHLADVPEHVDLAVVAVPVEQVLAVAEDAVEAGVSTLVVVTSGFAEMGAAGVAAQTALARLARTHSMRVVGPNCLGVMINDPEVRLNATFTRLVPPAGGLALGSQSGGVGIAVLDVATRLGLGVHSFISLGNKADVSGNDLLAAWMDDPSVTAAALYLESFGNARKFARVARAFAERKPLLGVVGGRSAGGVRAGLSHTAAVATPAASVDALFAQAGVIACHSAEDLVTTALLLSEQPLPRGNRVGVLSNAGGMGVLAADALAAQGLDVPEFSADLVERMSSAVTGAAAVTNPVDLGAGAGPEDLASAVEHVSASGEVDVLLVVLVATSVTDPGLLMSSLVEAGAAHRDCALVVVPMGGLDAAPGTHAGVTLLPSVDAAAGALARVGQYAAWLRQHREDGVADEDTGAEARADEARARAGALVAAMPAGDWLGPQQAVDLLSPYGLVPDGRVVADVDAAVEAALAVGFPVAVKVADPQVVHKTERGLVRTGLGSAAEVEVAVLAFERELGHGSVPVLVQPMVSGTELALGIVRDAGFGPLVMVAAGGTATELWNDRALLVPPVSRRDAARVVRSLRLWPLLDGYRGAARADVEGLEALVVSLGRLALEVPELAELDLNPVIVRPDGCVLVDVKARLTPTPWSPPTARQLRPTS